jgi:hypothetical protein
MMTSYTLDQAIRNALESERAAARFFRVQASREASPATHDLVLHFAERAEQDADKLERVASRVEEGEFAHYADIQVSALPAAPSWTSPEDVSSSKAVSAAKDFACQAAVFYDLLAEASPTHGPCFRELAAGKEELAHRLEGLMRLAQTAAAGGAWAPKVIAH